MQNSRLFTFTFAKLYLAAAGLGLFALPSPAQVGLGTETINPAAPTTSDSITATITGSYGGCNSAPQASVVINGYNIEIDLTSTYRSGVVCPQFIVGYTVSATIGRLAAGNYYVTYKLFTGSTLDTTATGTFTVRGNDPCTPTITSPAPGSTLGGSSVTFRWASCPTAAAYWLDVGTIQGQGNLFGQNVGSATSWTVNGIPTVGVTLYVRLWIEIEGYAGPIWFYKDFTFTEGSGTCVIALTSPTRGSTVGSTVTFSWNYCGSASAWWLDVGTSQGQGNIFGQNVGLATSHTVTITVSVQTIYVRLWVLINGTWTYVDFTFTVTVDPPTPPTTTTCGITSPTPRSTLNGSTVTFTWSYCQNATAYWLDVGTSQGQGNIFGKNVGFVNTQTVSGIPTLGYTLYVRLWAYIYGNWSYQDYTYNEYHGGGCTIAITSPAPGSRLNGSTVTFYWSYCSDATAWRLQVGTAQGQGNIFDQNVGQATNWTVSGIPTFGYTIYVRLWVYEYNSWSYQDFTYFEYSGGGCTISITSPTPGGTLTWFEGIPTGITFTWNYCSNATAWWLDVGTVQGQGNIFGQNVGAVTSFTVNKVPLPSGGTLYVRLWAMVNGVWSYKDFTYGATVNFLN